MDRDALILEHRRWAAGVAVGTVRDLTLPLSYDDAVSAAMVALVSCARRWQPGPATFRTYARHRIAGSVIDETRSSRLMSGGGRHAPESYRTPAPLPATLVHDEPDFPLVETIADLEAVFVGRDRTVLRLLAQGLTLAEVGDRVGVSASRVCQIRQDARRRLTVDPEPPPEPRPATPLRDAALEIVDTYRGATAPALRSVVRHLHIALQARGR